MDRDKRLAGKTAIVTGGAMGIGKAVTVRLAGEGATVVVADIDGDLAETVAKELQEAGGQAMSYRIDLSDVKAVYAMADAVARTYGRIDCLVNTVGICQSKPFLEVTEEEWGRILDVNLKGSVFCMQAVGAHMVSQLPQAVLDAGIADRCYGKIVNFSSISGRRGRPLQIHYAASKAAIISVTQSVALTFAAYGINVNAVSPSVVLTSMWDRNNKEKAKALGVDEATALGEFLAKIPMKRPGTVEEMASVVAFLCSSDSDYMTGQTLNVDGGFEMN